MSALSVAQLRQLFDSLANDYEALSETKAKLEGDCTRLRTFIETQVSQIQDLTNEFEKLRQECATRGIDLGAPLQRESQIQEDNADPDWKVVPLIPESQIQHPVMVSLVAEIVDISWVCATAFSPDGQCLAIGSDKALRIYNLEDNAFTYQPNIDDGESTASNNIRSIAWTNDSKTVICGFEDGKIRLFSVVDEQLVGTVDVSNQEVSQVCVPASNSMCAVVSRDGMLSLFSMPDFKLIKTMQSKSSEGIASSVAISPSERLIAVGYADGSVALWEATNHNQLLTKEVHEQDVYAMAFVPGDGPERLVTGSIDSCIKIWEIEGSGDGVSDMKLRTTLQGHKSYVVALAVDPTGEWLLSGSKDMTAQLSSISSGTMVYSVNAHTDSVIAVAFNPNGQTFCTGSGDHLAKIWSIQPEDVDDAQ